MRYHHRPTRIHAQQYLPGKSIPAGVITSDTQAEHSSPLGQNGYLVMWEKPNSNAQAMGVYVSPGDWVVESDPPGQGRYVISESEFARCYEECPE